MRLPFGRAAFLLLVLFILAFAFLSAHSSSCPPSTNDTPSAVKAVAPTSCTALPLHFEPGRPIYALAGYFRSGNSWTRHLLQRATGILTGSVYNDAALQRTGLWGEGVTEGTLVVKTHLLNTTLFHFSDLVLMRNGEEPRPPPLFLPAKGAIHLVRNPFDSIASWHQFLVTGSHFETTDEFDIDQWESHVLDEVDWWIRTTEYWLKAPERDPNFKYMLVRYEDLVKDTEGILRRMLHLIEAPMDEALIRCAVRSTDCTAMPWNCRSGKAGSLMHHYSNVQREYMIEKLGPLMLFLNYSVKDIPLDSDKDYVLGYRTPGTGYPLECRRSSAFIQGAIQTRKLLDGALKEADATPLDIPPEVLYDPPLIVFHPDWANWMGWATSSSNYYHKWGKVMLEKKPSKCRWTWAYQEEAHLAHVILMNGVPHVGKAGSKWCSKEFDVPAQKPFWQRWARMDYETFLQFPILAVPEWSALFDWRISWEKDADLHITMHCPFPTERTALDPPPPKEPGHLVAYIASRCEAHERDEYVRQLMEHIDVTSYGRCLNNAQLPDEKSGDWPRNWDIKLRELGKFKFALAFENYNVTDWVTEKMPQIIMAGAVPIYMGAPNIDEYVPGPKSIIKVSDFKSPKELAAYIKYLDENDDEYRKYFEWKRYPLSQGWQDDYNDCAYWQEHKLCDMALAEQAALRERWQHKIPPPSRAPEEAQAEGDADTEKEAADDKPKEESGDRENDQPNQDEEQCMDEQKCAPGKEADGGKKEGEAKATTKPAHPDPVEPLIPADNLEKKPEPTTQQPSPSPLPLKRDADEEEGLYREETGGEKRKRITQHIAQNSEAHTTPPPKTKSISKSEAAAAEAEDERRKGLADPKGFPVRRDPDMEIAKELQQAPGHEPAIRASAAKEVAAAVERRKKEMAEAKAREELARP